MKEVAHTDKFFDFELAELTGKISEMFQRTISQVDLTTQVLTDPDPASIQTLIQRDETVNRLCGEIDRVTVKLLALRQPVASDLRKVIGALKISNDLERIADYCVNIGRQVQGLKMGKTSGSMGAIIEMAGRAQAMVALAGQSFPTLNEAMAWKVVDLDDEVDAQYGALLNGLKEEMEHNPEMIEVCSSLLHIARHLERMGDHAVNIGLHVIFIATGRRDRTEEG